MTGAAGGRAGPGFGTGAVAGLASQGGWNFDLNFRPGVGLLKGDFQVVAKVIAPRRAASLTSTATPTEDVAEHFVEDVMNVVELSGPATALAVDTRMAKPVIGGALLPVGQDGVGLVDFLESRRRFLASAVAVRVVLHRQLAKRGFQSCVIAAAWHAENFVIVPHSRSDDRFGLNRVLR